MAKKSKIEKIEPGDFVMVVGGERDGLVGNVDTPFCKDGKTFYPVTFDEDWNDFVYAEEVKLYKKA